MKVKAIVEIDVVPDDLIAVGQEIGEDFIDSLTREVSAALHESDAFRRLKITVYNACLDAVRKEIAEEFIDKIKGES